MRKSSITLSRPGRNTQFTDQRKRDDWIKAELSSYVTQVDEKEQQLMAVQNEVKKTHLTQLFGLSLGLNPSPKKANIVLALCNQNHKVLSIPNTSDLWRYSSQVQAHQDKIQKLSGDIKERTDNLEDRKKEIEDTNKVRSENITPNKAMLMVQ